MLIYYYFLQLASHVREENLSILRLAAHRLQIRLLYPSEIDPPLLHFRIYSACFNAGKLRPGFWTFCPNI